MQNNPHIDPTFKEELKTEDVTPQLEQPETISADRIKDIDPTLKEDFKTEDITPQLEEPEPEKLTAEQLEEKRLKLVELYSKVLEQEKVVKQVDENFSKNPTGENLGICYVE